MKEIPLTQGMTATVDDEDYERLMQWKWYCAKPPHARTGYALRISKTTHNGQRHSIFLHRVIMQPPLGYEIDHINGNGLDNRKENLRVATRAQNQQHKDISRHNTSGFKGVSWNKHAQKWEVRIRINNKRIGIGLFKDKLEAALAYNEAAIKHHGDFAIFNQEGI